MASMSSTTADTCLSVRTHTYPRVVWTSLYDDPKQRREIKKSYLSNRNLIESHGTRLAKRSPADRCLAVVVAVSKTPVATDASAATDDSVESHCVLPRVGYIATHRRRLESMSAHDQSICSADMARVATPHVGLQLWQQSRTGR